MKEKEIGNAQHLKLQRWGILSPSYCRLRLFSFKNSFQSPLLKNIIYDISNNIQYVCNRKIYILPQALKFIEEVETRCQKV